MTDGITTNTNPYSNLRSIVRGVIMILLIASVFGYAYQHDTKALQDELDKCKEMFEQTQIKFNEMNTKPINLTSEINIGIASFNIKG